MESHLFFAGVSRPHLAPRTRDNQVGVFVPWTAGSPPSPPTLNPSTWERGWSHSVLVRDPSPEERAACQFGTSVIHVAEAIDVISSVEGDIFRSLELIEYFVVC